MGTSIHAYAERRTNDRWSIASINGNIPDDARDTKVLNWQNYTLFGWLADVRNYAMVPSISNPRGLPKDVSGVVSNMAAHARARGDGSFTWLSLRELVEFDYDATFEDRRTNGGGGQYGDTYPPGMGQVTTYREAFGQSFFNELEKLKALGDADNTRIVFWFD